VSLLFQSESESSLLQEIASLKHRVDDLQSSLKLLQQKDWDFQSLEQKVLPIVFDEVVEFSIDFFMTE